ncbi:MAG: DUF2975 domain-containing protein [Brevundimonas sp.]|uniref:DUF2975 domain-containing protein n=1 Tax=Brevundimonas sp. TaxID=1871086 RepID=UPI0025C1A129|nr:DUF2975 domain-containing protein [Brevundimonas sp.]MBX3477656.1 DUF2975 domain-containing protein [Brevundimonas sp.]
MNPADLTRFRRMCRQYRWLAVFMVASVGGLLALMYLVLPVIQAVRGEHVLDRGFWNGLIMGFPAFCYLIGVWSVGAAMKRIGAGDLLQPAIADTLRRVGLALGIGGVASVFLVTNISRLIGVGRGAYLYFDVPGMTLGMIGGALFLLGRVMEQAAAAQAELDEMI